MRVVCIDDAKQKFTPFVKKGNIYTVLEEYVVGDNKFHTIDGIKYQCVPGVYYKFLETGKSTGFLSTKFVAINEDQQDETEMERDYNKSVATN